ncbi:unnamed protein product [Bursaphelenchus okinawaensis]|uniref:G_PROTEIN_RECEP_F1_2 domain-containing protein n=1 Tax=Bursaphelenchus okinawaensis TaxID=465554 RepID=A0A811LDS2_9BILA|nr:unnamed protein product [Bursaphelenchus okinawaensis]CAG9120553.1 unnamed protein product [Bursaphelenchus okinawaensis]
MTSTMDETPDNLYAWEVIHGDTSISLRQCHFWLRFSRHCRSFIQLGGGVLNALLLVLIFKIKNKPLKNYKMILMFCALCDTQILISESVLQLVGKIKDNVLLLALDGPGGQLSYHCQALLVGIYAFHLGLIIVIQPANYFYRYMCVNSLFPPTVLVTAIAYALSAVVAAGLAVVTYLSYMYSAKPDVNYATLWFDYKPLPTLLIAETRSFYTQLYLGYAVVSFGISYLLCMIFAHKTVSTISKKQHLFGARTLQMQNQLATTLFVQTMMPMFTSVGPSIAICFSTFFGIDIGGIFGILMYTCLAFIPLLNPLATIFFIKPFRVTVLRMVSNANSLVDPNPRSGTSNVSKVSQQLTHP